MYNKRALICEGLEVDVTHTALLGGFDLLSPARRTF